VRLVPDRARSIAARLIRTQPIQALQAAGRCHLRRCRKRRGAAKPRRARRVASGRTAKRITSRRSGAPNRCRVGQKHGPLVPAGKRPAPARTFVQGTASGCARGSTGAKPSPTTNLSSLCCSDRSRGATRTPRTRKSSRGHLPTGPGPKRAFPRACAGTRGESYRNPCTHFRGVSARACKGTAGDSPGEPISRIASARGTGFEAAHACPMRFMVGGACVPPQRGPCRRRA